VHLMLDVRDTDLARRDRVMHALDDARWSIAKERGVRIEAQPINADAPADCAPQVIAALTDSCSELSLPFTTVVSRAYHDSLFMSRIAPTGMLFIPSRDGVSHRPDEYSSPEDIERGALVLAHALARLSA
jgi:ureidoglycolate amidohydrolase